ncbi:MAG: hypothetical protein Hyperionvirus36_22 [Hyperionvirus sp.]|uniref:RmlD-like substrate binding domain-containing protein n=1 Tax=Hyperionvirus sp. TaxID=2487770 RepID=A0A3G5ABZ9_9VIRU|nr:MAG: hypothetical protein Hyperionvirus36_22 [Hyperionvirus sp.]
MKILFFGANGWIGAQIIKLLSNHEIHQATSRADDIESVEKEIKRISPTHIISSIGRTHGTHNGIAHTTIDYLEIPGKLHENIKDNLFAPTALAILSMQHNIHLTYIGTGCIFEYDQNHPITETNGFTEADAPNFFGSSYSLVKGFTDQLMHLFPTNVLNIRIRMPITDTHHPRNFITKITQYKNICSIPNSMTVFPDLLPYLIDMIENQTTGTINLVSPGLISHNEILALYKEIVDPTFTWNNFSLEEQNKIITAKRSNNYLDSTKLLKLYPNVKPVHDAVRDALHTLKLS